MKYSCYLCKYCRKERINIIFTFRCFLLRFLGPLEFIVFSLSSEYFEINATFVDDLIFQVSNAQINKRATEMMVPEETATSWD